MRFLAMASWNLSLRRVGRVFSCFSVAMIKMVHDRKVGRKASCENLARQMNCIEQGVAGN